ncbi:hypothetical protein [Gorillibacterium massiliense]|uniref:hypothetical protein n=1 Tax=Gorillibacterium massiliense TaxID=1280390 RepID=UPI00059372FE|nr:hypothetical protein [Gorillibacterium massiliense]
MGKLMDFLESKGFIYTDNGGVDVFRVKKDGVSFVGYRMNCSNLSLVIGNEYVLLYLASESVLFKVSENEELWSCIQDNLVKT